MTRGVAAAVSICVLVAALLATPLLALAKNEAPWNLPAPTWGGNQMWRDSLVFAGWRIQENALTGSFRLLDPGDIRRAWGTYVQCRERLDDLKRSQGIRAPSKHLVLLVHGILRSSGTFSALERALIGTGFDAVAISYPSSRGTIEEHAEGLARLLDRQEGTDTVSFVTHSMGALVVRDLLKHEGAWQRRIEVRRIVLIAPPNQGSAIARLLKDISAYRLIYGAAGQQLTPEEVTRIPALDYPFAIIAGGKSDGVGFNPLLPGDDDGTVRLAETRLEGAMDFLVVPDIHAMISNHRETIRATINFLKHGKFDAASGVTR
ncbi:MAG: esterase/lipase family protein [Alphaproteobacteria bacterium]